VNGTVSALAVYNGELIAGGAFTTAGGVAANRIARWNGSSWQGIAGLDNTVLALHVHKGELVAGGLFSGTFTAPKFRWARWRPNCPRGDLNCDMVVDTNDVAPFVSGLIDSASLTPCTRVVADMNFDGMNDGSDIEGLVTTLLGS
jgi:hypothetical protein